MPIDPRSSTDPKPAGEPLCEVCGDTGIIIHHALPAFCTQCPTCDTCSEPLRLCGGLEFVLDWEGTKYHWCTFEHFMREVESWSVRSLDRVTLVASVFAEFAMRCGDREDAAETLAELAKLNVKTTTEWRRETHPPHGLGGGRW